MSRAFRAGRKRSRRDAHEVARVLGTFSIF